VDLVSEKQQQQKTQSIKKNKKLSDGFLKNKLIISGLWSKEQCLFYDAVETWL